MILPDFHIIFSELRQTLNNCRRSMTFPNSIFQKNVRNFAKWNLAKKGSRPEIWDRFSPNDLRRWPHRQDDGGVLYWEEAQEHYCFAAHLLEFTLQLREHPRSIPKKTEVLVGKWNRKELQPCLTSRLCGPSSASFCLCLLQFCLCLLPLPPDGIHWEKLNYIPGW